MKSLRARLLVAASLVLALFVALCGAGLDTAFRNSALQAEQDKLQGLVYAVLGATETTDNGGLTIPAGALPDPRLGRIDSGLSALIFNDKGVAIWHSPSFSGTVPALAAPPIGEALLREAGERFALTFGLSWLGESSKNPKRYTVAVLEDRGSYQAQLHSFRRTLGIALAIAVTALLILQGVVLRWGIQPIRRLAREVQAIESGEQSQVNGAYPSELEPLVQGLNAMIRSEHGQQTRYRNALGDLAHSLKTPLAALRGLVDSAAPPAPLRGQIDDQLARLQDITDYQLKRASAAGRRALSEPIAPRLIAEKTIAALGKVYAAKAVQFRNDLPATLRLRADQGDLYEVLGNLLENAAKWCKTQVRVSAEQEPRRITLLIDDDGPGFPPEGARLLQRGVRADTRVPGQGIGLATVADIIGLNEGRISLEQSPEGGGRVRVEWPL